MNSRVAYTHQRRLRGLGVATGLALLASGLSVPLAHASDGSTTVLYAAPNGSGDKCSGSSPCGLLAAQRRVRSLTPHMSGDVTVYLYGGTYRLSHTLRLTNADSGSGGHRVTYTAYPGQEPVISGARRVTGFALYDPAKSIYRAKVPAGTSSRQLFVNGVRAQRARGPLNPSGFSNTGSSFVTSDPSYLSYTNVKQVEVVQDNDWKQQRCPLTSITRTSTGGSSLNVDPTCWADNNTAVPNPSFPFNGSGVLRLSGISWIENAYQLLTRPGQFYLDSHAGYLYYIPRAGESMTTADVELPALQELVDVSGSPGHLAPVNDTDAHAVYQGAWSHTTGTSYGDLDNDVHETSANGASVSYSFTGTGVEVLGETNSDEGGIDVYVDGHKKQHVSAKASTRLAQQQIVTVVGLARGHHTVRLVKTDGQQMVVDGFTVIPSAMSPVHNITFSDIVFAYTTWTQPTSTGYLDNQAGVLWNPTTKAPTRIPAAVQVHRGKGIEFSDDVIEHTGGTGIDLADGSQNSTVVGNLITDTSGGGVSLGEVDDYYQADTSLMTTGDTVSQNTINHVGQDYQDAVGIWVGYTRDAVIAHNDIGYTPYSGMSLGWGWGWASPCSMQTSQGLSTCRHGTIYAGGNKILDNWVHNVMGVLHDGGPIYTNGGQGDGNGSATSVFSGNVLGEGNDTNNMLYHDEGSSYWNTYDNVTEFGGGDWLGMWTPTIHDITVHDNFTDNPNSYNHGTNVTVTGTTLVSGGNWPAAARAIMAAAGPSAAHQWLRGTVDDDSPAIDYSGVSWFGSGFRNDGDLDDGVHAATANGDSATYSFTGTGVTVLGERNSDQGTVAVSVDGVSHGVVDTSAPAREAQQQIFSINDLPLGAHTIRLAKVSGQYMTLDGFEVRGAANDTDPALRYSGGWQHTTGDTGAYRDDLHVTRQDGAFVTVPFFGTGLTVYADTGTKFGQMSVTLDGRHVGDVDLSGAARAQQMVLEISNLSTGYHQLSLTKLNGDSVNIDRVDTL